jgi:type IV secretory pathway VirB4 component
MNANKIQFAKKAANSREPYIPYELKSSITEAEELLDEITKNNQKLFYTAIYINIIAESLEELKERTISIQNVARRYLCNCVTLTHQQEEALTAASPLGRDLIKNNRTLLTKQTAIFMPFTSEELFQQNGFYYGMNQLSKSLILLDRKGLENPAGFILGRPRSGKSFSAKREIVNILLKTDDDIIVIDPENEFSALCQNFSSEVIRIAANSQNYLNPFEMTDDYGADEDPIALKSEFILSVCECLVGTFKPIEKTIIDRCVKIVYQEFIAGGFDTEHLPTFVDFHKTLLCQPEEEARNLAIAIEIYVTGSLNMFSKKTNVDMKNRFTNFNTKDLGKQLKTLGMLNCLDFVWNKVCQNCAVKKRTWVYIDEFYMLFYSDFTASFFNEFFKRSQKRGGIPTGITQNVTEILANQLATNMLSNSEFILMFNQSNEDREKLGEKLKISPLQLSYVIDPEEGCGIIMVKGRVYPFQDRFQKDTDLYWRMTIKVAELFENGGQAR